MSKVYTLQIKCCRECAHYTNNAQLHNDAFSSAPAEMREYCTNIREGRLTPLYNNTWGTVSDKCQLPNL